MSFVILFVWFVGNVYAEHCSSIEMLPIQQQYCTGNNITGRMSRGDCSHTESDDDQGPTCHADGYACCFVKDASFRVSNDVGYICCLNKSSDSKMVMYIVVAAIAVLGVVLICVLYPRDF